MLTLDNTKPLLGIAATTYFWQYANEGIDFMSKKLDRLIKTTNIPDEVTKYIGSTAMVGVALGSQIFVKACPVANHSPAVSFVEKAIIGYTYYLPGALITGCAENLLKQYVAPNYVIYPVALLSGAMVGTFSGNLIQTSLGNNLDKVAANVDISIGTVFVVLMSLIGKAKSENIEEDLTDAAQNDLEYNNIDTLNITVSLDNLD